MIIKIDMSNVFDTVKDSFMFDVMLKFSFCPSFIKWVSFCMSNLWIAPLVNGRTRSIFKGRRRLMQGFLLSPQLYIIMEKSLSMKLETNSHWRPFRDQNCSRS
jgi:hypothetical protein